MEISQLAKIVALGAEDMGISLPPAAIAAFELYHDILAQQGEHVNLTAISGVEDVARLHFLDSISLIKITQLKGTKIIDIGAGAGFPGIPLKIAEPSIELTLLDATYKRVVFLSGLCASLGVEVECIHGRAEELAHDTKMREQFDICVSRAVARLNTLCELCLPFVRVGGTFLAMKGLESEEEITESQSAIKALGSELQEVYDYPIPGTDIRHRAVIIRKSYQTKPNYPRRFAKMQKRPL